MMTSEQEKRISKRLSLHLRHQPEDLGLTLADGGWVDVDVLLERFSAKYFPLTREELAAVVAGSDKQRFAFDQTGMKIRASQGHSVGVNLGLEPATPPEQLYHGTARPVVAAILAEGLKRMSRDHVHLSPDKSTAIKVGSRHGAPVVLVVRAGDMFRAGHIFYQSANGVWLTDTVPPEWLEVA